MYLRRKSMVDTQNGVMVSFGLGFSYIFSSFSFGYLAVKHIYMYKYIKKCYDEHP